MDFTELASNQESEQLEKLLYKGWEYQRGGFCTVQAEELGNGNGRSRLFQAPPCACRDPTGPMGAWGAPNAQLGSVVAAEAAISLGNCPNGCSKTSGFQHPQKSTVPGPSSGHRGVCGPRGSHGGVGDATRQLGPIVTAKAAMLCTEISRSGYRRRLITDQLE